jgi:uncharacterized membrane protein
MGTQSSIRSAILGLLAVGALSGVASATEPASKEKCYGVSKVGQNDCADAAGKHACAGQSKADNDPQDWKYVATGTCAKIGGKVAPATKS